MSDPTDIELPARVTVRCPACGHVRSSLVLHSNALERIQRCERCGGDAEVVAEVPARAFACPCCG
jgi:transcription elongation factor Elf1